MPLFPFVNRFCDRMFMIFLIYLPFLLSLLFSLGKSLVFYIDDFYNALERSTRSMFDDVIRTKGAPSSASTAKKANTLQTDKSGFWCHRPANLVGPHVALFCPSFGRLAANWRNSDVGKDACQFVVDFVADMSEYYDR